MNFPLSKSFSAAQQLASPAKQKSGGKGHRSGARSTSSRSYSSSSSSSDSESEQTARGVAQSKVVVLGSEQPKVAVLPVYHALRLLMYNTHIVFSVAVLPQHQALSSIGLVF